MLSLLSLPRDLYVNIPGLRHEQINNAYANGGAPLAIKTVSQVLGVKINYYVPVNFHLFRKTVDVFHGVYIDVDRRYYHANDSAGNYAAIDLKPGYQKLSGFQALQYVRYRHLDSDFIRTARQQAFVREFKRRLDVWSAGTNLFDLLDSLPNDLKVRGSAKGQSVGPKTILRYVKLLAEIPRGKMVQVRITGSTPMINSDSVVPSHARGPSAQAVQGVPEPPTRRIAQSVASRFSSTVVGGAKPPAKKKAGPKAIPPARLKVVTVNGSGVQGVAASAMVALQKAGWPHTGVGGHAAQGEPVLDRRLLLAAPKARLSAERLRRSLGLACATAAAGEPAELSDFGLHADVVVAIGSAFSGVTPPPEQAAKQQAPAPERPLVQSASSSDAGNFFAPPENTGYKLLYPSRACRSAPPTARRSRRARTPTACIASASTARPSRSTPAPRRTPRMRGASATRSGRTLRSSSSRVARSAGSRTASSARSTSSTNGTAIHRIAVFYGGQRPPRRQAVWSSGSTTRSTTSCRPRR